jgi:hypothetical protein
MDQPWLSVFDNSMHQPWLYFFYRFDASIVISLTLSIPRGSCHSVFIDDFKVYNDSVFADDLWISSDIAFLTIPCVSHDSIFPIDLMRQSWIHWRYRFHAVVVCGRCHSVFIDDFKVYCYSVLAGDLWISRDIAFLTMPCVGHDNIFACDWMRRSWIHWRCRFHAVPVTQHSWTVSRSTVTLFWPPIYRSAMTAIFWIPCVSHDSIFAIDLMRRSWIQWCYWFHTSAVTQYSLTISRSTFTLFGRRFMDKLWQSVFDNSMRQPWLYFYYRFDVSFVNSVTLSIPHGSCQSVFSDDLEVYNDSVFAADLWISSDIAFLAIPCVGHDSIFSIDLMRRSWIQWRCRFHTAGLTQYSLMISRSTVTLFSAAIYGSAVT